MCKEFTHVQRVRILFKTILKLHRGMPEALQVLGNNYVKDEFKRHKTCNPAEASVFMNEWTGYALNLSEQLGLRGPRTAKPLGLHLSSDQLDALNDQQVRQLYELLQAASNLTEDSTGT
ncbi:hypothetical protein R5R35_007175 [Gryllus longicercus]|uniref:Succinate dehydrogenase assembly factor 3 n=1 Tax=Gryllus longicercus TaxID=2509291 RepID=A0AAN9V807_9ORTH|nr:Succinate dehydrogenase assembly factor 3, mitochondrial [Gryllus bimaculatus]